MVLLTSSPTDATHNNEIVRNIVDFLEDEDKVSSACVCKLWSQHALDSLWRHLESIMPVFLLIGPLERNEDDKLVCHSKVLTGQR